MQSLRVSGGLLWRPLCEGGSPATSLPGTQRIPQEALGTSTIEQLGTEAGTQQVQITSFKNLSHAAAPNCLLLQLWKPFHRRHCS